MITPFAVITAVLALVAVGLAVLCAKQARELRAERELAQFHLAESERLADLAAERLDDGK